MTQDQLSNLLDIACKASYFAGKAILDIYESDFSVELKSDDSPLTLADQQSHLEIVKALKKTDIPLLSEEGKSIPFEERNNWEYFWMIDPLDGTKEFVKRNGEFTVNIALIHQNRSILGVIYVPVKDELYFAAEGVGSFKLDNFSKQEGQANLTDWIKEGKQLPIEKNRQYTVVGSRSHMSSETEDFINQKKFEVGEIDMISVGSSLKLCMVAEGKADVYPRFAPTMEWDTAAGQAIVECMGGNVINWETKKTMKYNKENLLNSWFLVST